MSQVRRDRFEQQLRSLQTDIGKLSKRIVDSAGLNVQLNATSISESVDEIVDAGTDKGLIMRLKRELRLVMRERDDVIFKLEQMKREMEHIQASVNESLQLKLMYDSLKQEYESMKVSFESSERIRRQQKDLISLLQRSHTLNMAENASVRSSLSSILEPPSPSPSPSAVAAENRSWLNSFVSSSRTKPSFDRSALASVSFSNPKNSFSFAEDNNNSNIELEKTLPRPVVPVPNSRAGMNRDRPLAPALQRNKAVGSTTSAATTQKKRGVIARSRSQSELSGAEGGAGYAARRRIDTNSSIASAPATNGIVEFGRPPTYPVGNPPFRAVESPGEPGPGQSSILSQYLSSAAAAARPRDGDRMYSTYGTTVWESAAESSNQGGDASGGNGGKESRGGGGAIIRSERPMSAPAGTKSRRRSGSGLSDGLRDPRDVALTLKQQGKVGNKPKRPKSSGAAGLSQGARRLVSNS